jgi:pyridoxal phosphate enzyme (YggS family)
MAELTTTVLPSVAEIRARYDDVRSRIGAVASGRDVTVVGVTKTFGPDLVERAAAAGIRSLGENYAQELVAKVDHLAQTSGGDAPPVEWHFIGGLQRNKVKLLAGKVALWETVDRPSLVTEIAKRSPGDRILIQVNTTGEGQKSGCDPDEAAGLVELARSLGLDVRGLMTIGPTGGDDPRPAFELLADLGDRLALPELSMGMSGDFELAVECGSTMVRVGTALFGPRHR